MANIAAALPSQPRTESAGLRILVADDDPTSRILLGAALEEEYGPVVDVEDGLRALQELEAQPFDLALIDLDMPVLDGFGVISKARSDSATRHLPIIVVTGRDDVVAIERAFALGATSFLCKPLNWSVFRHQVRYVLKMTEIDKQSRIGREQAEFLSSLRDDSLRVIDREVRDVLTAIMGYSSVIATENFGPAGNPQYPEMARDILTAAENLLATMDRVKRGADVLTGAGKTQWRAVPVVDLISDAIEKVALTVPEFDPGRIDVGPVEDMALTCDRGLVAEALAHVLENALVFSPLSQRVRVSAVAAADRQLRFEVEDRGPGIPEDMLDAGFKPFVRRTAKGSGNRAQLGLGFATARAVVDGHGGHFGVMSELGRGTEVFLSFPMVETRNRVNAV